MAKIVINDVDMISLSGPHVATSWRVMSFNEEEGTDTILFESLQDKDNLLSIIATLRYPDGRYYPPERGSRPFVKFHFLSKLTNELEESDWYSLIPCGTTFLLQELSYTTK